MTWQAISAWPWPKIMPLKSVTLERIEEMEKAAAAITDTMMRQSQQQEEGVQ